MNSLFQPLLFPEKLYSATTILSNPSLIPAEPGLYAWYFREIPPGVPTDGCCWHNNLALLYVGISPSRLLTKGKPDEANLQKRIHIHLRRKAQQSTLRRTLGCLLSQKLGLCLQKTGSGKKMNFGEGEKKLSEWMADNAFVTWIVQPDPWNWERALIEAARPPLNLDGNSNHPFHAMLTSIKSDCRNAARSKE